MKDTKVQWHPGFVADMNLELAKNRDDLIFVKEYNLNTKPLDIDTFYKVGAYAGLYKAYGETVDAIKADDITVSLVRDAKPVEFFKYFEAHQYSITRPFHGVYYIEGAVLFPTQIIVTRELESDAHIWLKALSDRIEKQDMEELLKRISLLTEQGDREMADSVLEVSAQVNWQKFYELRGDGSMSEALLEMFMPIVEPLVEARIEPIIEARMEPIIEARIEKRVLKEGIKKGIQGTVEVLRDLGHEDTEIRKIIQKKYDLSDEETAEYV